MQLNNFTGGLSVRLDPSLIQPGEAVLYTNIDNTSGPLQSALGYQLSEVEARGYMYHFKDVWISSYIERDYLEYDNVLYFTEKDGRAQKTGNGLLMHNLGVDAPLPVLLYEDDGVTPVLDGDGTQVDTIYPTEVDPEGDEDPLSGQDITVQYTYTYYNSGDDTEGPPAEPSIELEVTAGKVVRLQNISFSTDPQVTHIRIYRLGLNTTMQLVKEVPNNVTEARDAVPVTELGRVLDTYDNQAPAVGLQYLVEAYGVLFAAKDNLLYYSKVGKPNYWPAGQSFFLKDKITGLLPIQNGIFVYTLSETYMLMGRDLTDFELVPVSKEYGCTSHKGCKLVRNTPVWPSLDGFASWSNGMVQVISKDKLGKLNITVRNAAVWDETYFVLDSDGNILAMDLRFGGLAFKRYDFLAEISDLAAFGGVLYAIADERVVTMFSGEALDLSWRSGELAEGSMTMTKTYNIVYVRFEGEFTFNIYINGRKVASKRLSGSGNPEVKVPQDLQRGESIQFEVFGRGRIWEIEYKPVGRTNGR